MSGGVTGDWPEPVARVSSFLAGAGAEARLEEVRGGAASAAAAADAIGCTLGQIVKSIVMRCDDTAVMALVPGDRKVDSGKLARLTGARRARIASGDDVRSVTGFPPGGVAPFAMTTVLTILLDRRLLRHGVVWVGGGSETHLVRIAPPELARLSAARVEDLVLESG